MLSTQPTRVIRIYKVFQYINLAYVPTFELHTNNKNVTNEIYVALDKYKQYLCEHKKKNTLRITMHNMCARKAKSNLDARSYEINRK